MTSTSIASAAASTAATPSGFAASIKNVQTMLTDRDWLGASLALVEVEKLAALACSPAASAHEPWEFRVEAAHLCELVRNGDTAGAGAAIRKMERFISPPVHVATQQLIQVLESEAAITANSNGYHPSVWPAIAAARDALRAPSAPVAPIVNPYPEGDWQHKSWKEGYNGQPFKGFENSLGRVVHDEGVAARQAVPAFVPDVSARIDERRILEVAARLGSRSLHVTRAHEIGGKTRTIMEEAGLIEFARALSELTPSQSADERVRELEDLLRTTLACLEESGPSLPDGFGRNGRLFGWLRDALAGAAPVAIQVKFRDNEVEWFGEDIPNGTYRLLPDSTLPTDPAKEKQA